MKELKQTVVIDRPIGEVFVFAINPANTSKWVDSIAIEQTNEWPVRLGTIYRSQNHAGGWSELRVTNFETNKVFTMRLPDGGYVSYGFSAPDATIQPSWITFGQAMVDSMRHI